LGVKKRMFFELFADTGAKKRGPELAGSLIRTASLPSKPTVQGYLAQKKELPSLGPP
jgi:hypothetical protein